MRVLRVEGRDALDDVLQLLGLQLREHRQRERLGCRLLGGGEIPRCIAKIGEAFLPMQRYRIVDLGADIVLRKIGPECIAARDTQHVLVPDVTNSRRSVWQTNTLHEPCASEGALV